MRLPEIKTFLQLHNNSNHVFLTRVKILIGSTFAYLVFSLLVISKIKKTVCYVLFTMLLYVLQSVRINTKLTNDIPCRSFLQEEYLFLCGKTI